MLCSCTSPGGPGGRSRRAARSTTRTRRPRPAAAAARSPGRRCPLPGRCGECLTWGGSRKIAPSFRSTRSARAVDPEVEPGVAPHLVEELLVGIVVVVGAPVRPADHRDDEIAVLPDLLVAHRRLEQVRMLLDPFPEMRRACRTQVPSSADRPPVFSLVLPDRLRAVRTILSRLRDAGASRADRRAGNAPRPRTISPMTASWLPVERLDATGLRGIFTDIDDTLTTARQAACRGLPCARAAARCRFRHRPGHRPLGRLGAHGAASLAGGGGRRRKRRPVPVPRRGGVPALALPRRRAAHRRRTGSASPRSHGRCWHASPASPLPTTTPSGWSISRSTIAKRLPAVTAGPDRRSHRDVPRRRDCRRAPAACTSTSGGATSTRRR